MEPVRVFSAMLAFPRQDAPRFMHRRYVPITETVTCFQRDPRESPEVCAVKDEPVLKVIGMSVKSFDVCSSYTGPVVADVLSCIASSDHSLKGTW